MSIGLSEMEASSRTVPGQVSGQERRQSVRLPVLPERTKCVLSDGKLHVPVLLMNQSADGFGFRCDVPVPWTAGQTLRLSTDEDSYEVQLMNLAEQDGQRRMGVRRIGDLTDERGVAGLDGLFGLLRQPPGRKVLGNWITTVLCLVILTCIPAIALVLWSLSDTNGNEFEIVRHRVSGRPGSWVRSIADFLTGSSQVQLDGSIERRNDAGQALADRLWNEIVSGNQQVGWREIEVVLQLTEHQSTRLQRLLDAKFHELAEARIDTQADAAQRRQIVAAMVESLPDQAMSFLNPEQRRRLRSLLASLAQQ